MTSARHRCSSLLMAKDQFTSYIPTSRYDSNYVDQDKCYRWTKPAIHTGRMQGRIQDLQNGRYKSGVKWSAEGRAIEMPKTLRKNWWEFPLQQPTWGVWGSVLSFLSGVWSSAPAENGILMHFERTPVLTKKFSIFYTIVTYKNCFNLKSDALKASF